MTVDVSVRSSLHGNADGLYHPPLPENPTSDTLHETNNFCASFVVGATTGDRSTTFLEDENQFEPDHTQRGPVLTLAQSSQRISISMQYSSGLR